MYAYEMSVFEVKKARSAQFQKKRKTADSIIVLRQNMKNEEEEVKNEFPYKCFLYCSISVTAIYRGETLYFVFYKLLVKIVSLIV